MLPAQAGTEIDDGATLRTGQQSAASLLFFDGSTVDVAETTEVSVDELRPRSSGGLTISLSQSFGRTLHRVVSLTGPEDTYEVKTPSGVASVRGTVFSVVVSDVSTTVSVSEGLVVLTHNGREIGSAPTSRASRSAMDPVPGAQLEPPGVVPADRLRLRQQLAGRRPVRTGRGRSAVHRAAHADIRSDGCH